MNRPPRHCPHCLALPISMANHLRDTGTTATLPVGACPALFAARSRRSHVTVVARPYDWARDPELADREHVGADGWLRATVG